ncbi:hypothetical protein T4D_8522 [Trichinella pseudospiralis]|uniref:Uncharacterized protein n=1 Tax=Trichinella pseudospiralis TaxID=6337 RepID=A0A0V1CHW9_TRIPS|nr:hypothetical protein T4D_8522 [Trichinella pseudospiralis]
MLLNDLNRIKNAIALTTHTARPQQLKLKPILLW